MVQSPLQYSLQWMIWNNQQLPTLVEGVRNKLECLSLASLSSLVKSWWVRPDAYPKVEHLIGASLRQTHIPNWKDLTGTSTGILKAPNFLKRFSFSWCRFYINRRSRLECFTWQSFLAEPNIFEIGQEPPGTADRHCSGRGMTLSANITLG